LTALDWKAIEESLWRFGYAKAGSVLTPAECAELAEVPAASIARPSATG